mmetsp:Transcript_27865/g.80018  ORF Transcript_27865/g.80018 Transcript_27865/m.80018 type:complete len:299 (+) Transcript_27865:100-996(+)
MAGIPGTVPWNKKLIGTAAHIHKGLIQPTVRRRVAQPIMVPVPVPVPVLELEVVFNGSLKAMSSQIQSPCNEAQSRRSPLELLSIALGRVAGLILAHGHWLPHSVKHVQAAHKPAGAPDGRVSSPVHCPCVLNDGAAEAPAVATKVHAEVVLAFATQIPAELLALNSQQDTHADPQSSGNQTQHHRHAIVRELVRHQNALKHKRQLTANDVTNYHRPVAGRAGLCHGVTQSAGRAKVAEEASLAVLKAAECAEGECLLLQAVLRWHGGWEAVASVSDVTLVTCSPSANNGNVDDAVHD